MKAWRVFVGSALVSICLTFDDAQAQAVTEFSEGIGAGSFSDVDATDAASDLIFEADFDVQENGGTSCNAAPVLGPGATYSSDTVSAPNWMSSFGPLLSPSNDVVYKFVAGPDVAGSIVPTGANYTFAMYLIASCSDLGGEPQPIGATSTLGRGIDLAASGVISGNTYYLAITGPASGGPGANGTLNFTTPFSIAIAPRF